MIGWPIDKENTRPFLSYLAYLSQYILSRKEFSMGFELKFRPESFGDNNSPGSSTISPQRIALFSILC
jgi:hypothetical protein